MKVYVITEGEYSDYHIEKVFLDKAKAEEFCALQNRKGNSYNGSWDIEEYETSDAYINSTGIVRYLYTYWIDKSHAIPKTLTPSVYVVGYDKEPTVRDGNPNYSDFIRITFTLQSRDEEKARKILFDTYAKYKANREGIT